MSNISNSMWNALDSAIYTLRRDRERELADDAEACLAALRSRLSSADALLARLSNLEGEFTRLDILQLKDDASEWREEGKK
jgi:hypothetical protein